MLKLKTLHTGIMLCLLLVVTQAHAEPLRLTLPIQCTVGTDCWIVNYVDNDPGPKARNYTCQYQTYDGHKGTDFVLASMAAQRAGVPVLASASGVVLGMRNDMEDISIRDVDRATIKGRECGNGVVLAHEDGWETQYCHMQRGSVIVRAGDRVQQGDTIGLVGLSGLTEMPHAHLSVRHNGDVVDPFDLTNSRDGKSVCGPSAERTVLWDPALVPDLGVPSSAVYLSGFAGGVPTTRHARNGGYSDVQMDARLDALLFWVDMFWVEPTDDITVTMIAPDGTVMVTNTHSPPQVQARRFVYVGKKRKTEFWPKGVYTGTVEIKRPLKGGGSQTITGSRTVSVQ